MQACKQAAVAAEQAIATTRSRKWAIWVCYEKALESTPKTSETIHLKLFFISGELWEMGGEGNCAKLVV